METKELTALGLTPEQAASILAINGKDIEAAKAEYSDYTDLKTQLAEADKTINDFKAMDVESIRKAADEWKAKAEKAEKDAAAKIAELEFNTLLDSTIATAKGRNTKAVRAMLDTDALKASKNRDSDLKAALDAVKAEHSYLFEGTDRVPPPRIVSGTPGTAPTALTKEAFKTMSYKDCVALKAANPALYDSVKE